MSGSSWLAIAAVLLGGLLNGSFVAPSKKLRGWQWEHGWFFYSITGLLVLPWLAVIGAGVPSHSVAAAAEGGVLSLVLFYGFGWGVGSVLFGLGVNRMGLALGYGLILGLIAPIGTFLPLVALYPERLRTTEGVYLLIGTLVVLCGIALLATAGWIREKACPELAPRAHLPAKSFFAGVLICVLSGIFSPMLNFAFVFGEPLRESALRDGASDAGAVTLLWAVTLTAGFVPNAGFALYLVLRNRSGSHWKQQTIPNLCWSALMGVLCYGSFLMYGFGAAALGRLVGILGWPLFMSMSLVTSNLLGKISGEWKTAPARAVQLSWLGIGALIVAIVIIAAGRGQT